MGPVMRGEKTTTIFGNSVEGAIKDPWYFVLSRSQFLSSLKMNDYDEEGLPGRLDI